LIVDYPSNDPSTLAGEVHGGGVCPFPPPVNLRLHDGVKCVYYIIKPPDASRRPYILPLSFFTEPVISESAERFPQKVSQAGPRSSTKNSFKHFAHLSHNFIGF